jgi:hypothetical protein
MRRLIPLTISLAATLLISTVAHAGGSEPPDPNLYDTQYGTVAGIRYSSDSEPYKGTTGGSAHVDAGCGSPAYRLIGGGAVAGGGAAHAWQSFNVPIDYTDADIEPDDGFRGVGYGPRGSTYRVFAICMSDAQLDYRRVVLPSQPGGARSGTLDCVGAGWHVVSGSGAISTAASWLTSSFPIDDEDAGKVRDDGWRITAYDTVNGLGGFKIVGICAKNLPRHYIKGGPSTVAAGAITKRKVSCGSDHVVGGGVKVSGSAANARLVVSAPYDGNDADKIPDDGWRTKVYNRAGAAKQVTSFAICVES